MGAVSAAETESGGRKGRQRRRWWGGSEEGGVMWEFVFGELPATLQGRREIPGDVMPFDAASDVPMEEHKGVAMKNFQKALIGKDAGKAAVLLGVRRSV